MSENKRTVTRKDAFELFEEMRHSTPEEQQLMREMMDRLSIPIEPGQNVIDLIEDRSDGNDDIPIV